MGIGIVFMPGNLIRINLLALTIVWNHFMSMRNFKRSGFQKRDGIISLVLAPILVIVIFLLGLLFQFLSFSTPTEIKKLRGQGKVETYDIPYEEVFHTAVDSINERGLIIVESNKEGGYIIATDGSGFLYEGRVIALFFTPESSKDRTKVEVLSKFAALPPLKELILPRNRASQILDNLSKHLESSNGNR